jgi:hypothetical protein
LWAVAGMLSQNPSSTVSFRMLYKTKVTKNNRPDLP